MPRSFLEYTDAEKVQPRSTVMEFFELHPGLKAEVIQAREQGFMWVDIFRWLKKDYDFPVKAASSLNKFFPDLATKR